jgi:hypothetical protein
MRCGVSELGKSLKELQTCANRPIRYPGRVVQMCLVNSAKRPIT